MVFFNPSSDRWLAYLAIVGALVFLLMFGVLGIFRSAPFGVDFQVFYSAAKVFVSGANPWVELVASGHAFAYPPHTASLLAFYGFLPPALALTLHTAINIASIFIIAGLANRWFIRGSVTSLSLPQGLALAVIVGNPFTAHSVFEGQIALPAAAALFLSWHFLRTQRWLLAGLLLGVATIKPQVSMLYLVWLLLNGNFRVLLVGAAAVLLLLLPAFAVLGPVEAFLSWFQSFAYYNSVTANIPGSFHVVGLESFFAAIDIGNLGWVFKASSVIALLLLFHYRHYVTPELTVNLFLVLALTFIYGHDTDYAVLGMVFSMLLFLAMQHGWSWRLALAALVLLALFFPQRFLREIPFPPLHHTRTFVVPLCCILVFLWQPSAAKQCALAPASNNRS